MSVIAPLLQPAARVKSGSLSIDGESLSLQTIGRVARDRMPAHLSREPHVLDRLMASLTLRDELIEQGVPIYGVTTGFGDSAHRQISASKAEALQRSLVRMLGCGTGAYTSIDEARATVLVRANCLARGHSAVRPVVVERLLELLNAEITPAIPEQGSVGASGDLVPLSYVAAALQGDRHVFSHGVLRPAHDALSAAGIAPLVLTAKEALALVNGTAYMCGVASLAALDATRIALAADVCTALTTEVLTGLDDAYHPFVHDVAKPHPGQIRSAAHVRQLLRGSTLVQTYRERLGESGSPPTAYRELPRRVQDRYSLRCAPHFVGVLWDTLSWTQNWLTTEVNSSNDNPLFDVEAGRSISGGNFAGGHVAMAMDSLRTSVASIADLLDRQLALVVDEKFNEGLPANLAPHVPQGHAQEGLRHGFKGAQIACSALTAEALHLCMPLTAFSRSTECHNQDKVSMGSIAARRTREVVRLTQHVVAIHLLALCQAADLRGPDRLGATRSVYERVRAVAPGVSDDRELEGDIAAVAELVRDGSLFSGLDVEPGVQVTLS